MTAWYFTGHDPLLYGLGAGAWIAAGALIGASHFLTLRWNVQMIAASRSLLLALAGQLVRFALTAGLLAVIAGRFGALPLLAATLGILAARTAVVQVGARR